MSETSRQLNTIMGSRLERTDGVADAFDTLENLACSDMLTGLTILSQVRSKDVTVAQAITGTQFHAPSQVPARDFHWLENVIYESNPDLDFIELSPLQPFGLNRVLAGTNQKNVVSALRRSEVNADATTALFREAYLRHIGQPEANVEVRLGAHVRTVRAQKFDSSSKFLPHFKVFGEVSIGRQSERFGEQETSALVDHLAAEINILDSIASSKRSNIGTLRVRIGNVAFLNNLIDQGRVDAEEVRRHTADPEYDMIAANNLDIPDDIMLDDPNLLSTLKDVGLNKGVKVLDMTRQAIEAAHPELTSRVAVHLSRVAGIGYYRHMCYKIDATSKSGLAIPVADGGTTDWATKVAGNKQLYSVTSGIGTELVARHLIN